MGAGKLETQPEMAAAGQACAAQRHSAAWATRRTESQANFNDRRRAIAARYQSELRGRVGLPFEPDGCRAVYHVFVVEHAERDRLASDLAAAGISTMVHYPKAIHEHTVYRALGEPGQFPVAERLARTVLSLPCFPEMTEAEQDHVIRAVKDAT